MTISLNQIYSIVWGGWLATWPSELIAFIWIGWIASWVIASLWSGQTENRVTVWGSLTYQGPIIAGALLLTPWVAQALHVQPLWDVGESSGYALAGLTLAGVLFAWWARVHLGTLWSNAITRKVGHWIVESGPYRYVRHPIYTSLIFAILATGIAIAEVPSLLGAMLISFGLWQKARMEERFLMMELGMDTYESYRRRVPMLIPFLPSFHRPPKRP